MLNNTKVVNLSSSYKEVINLVFKSSNRHSRIFLESLEIPLESFKYRSFVQRVSQYCSNISRDEYNHAALEALSKSMFAYKVSGNTLASQVYWPNPERYPETDLHSLKPYIDNKPILSKSSKIISLGSCFAMEIGHRLLSQGYNYYFTQSELPSGVQDNLEISKTPNFSAYYGIIFNTLSLRYLIRRAMNDETLPRILLPWHKNISANLFIDPFREGIAFRSIEAYNAEYNIHANALREAFSNCDVLIWTFGLSEAWVLKQHPNLAVSYGFQSFFKPFLAQKVISLEEHITYFAEFYQFIKSINPQCKFIISVSPIPLAATYQHESFHVVEANMLSKSEILVASRRLEASLDDVFYLPAYELVTHVLKEPWHPDQRHVSSRTADSVVNLFLEMFSSN
jgi:hypothetical protein